MEVCKEELCESNEIHEDLLKIVDETLPEETELYDLAETLPEYAFCLFCLRQRYVSAISLKH